MGGASHGRSPYHNRPFPGLRGDRVATPPLLARSHRIPSGGSPWLSAPLPFPLRGHTRRPFQAESWAPMPSCVLTNLLHTSAYTDMAGRHSALWSTARGRSGCSTHPGPRPCRASFRSIGSAKPDPDGRTSEPDTACVPAHPSLRGGIRPHRAEARWSVTRRWRVNATSTANEAVTGCVALDIARPTTFPSSGRAPTLSRRIAASLYSHQARKPRWLLTRGERRARLGHLQPIGRRHRINGDRGRGQSAWLVLPGTWMSRSNRLGWPAP